MRQTIYDFTKSAIIRVCNSEELFFKELSKASKVLRPYEQDKLINWLFFYTADKPDMQKWLYEVIDRKILVS